MSNFAISGSLSSAFSGGNVTASATGITCIKVSAGVLENINGLPITIEGQGLGNRTVDISSYLAILDQLQSFAKLVTVTMTCTSNATLSIKVDGNEFVSCGFAVAEDGTPSFSANGLETIFDTLTVEGDDIVAVKANGEDVTVTEEVIEDPEVVDLPKAGDSFIDRFANQTGIWGGDDYTSEVADGQVTWTTAGGWSGIGAWFNSGVDEDVAGLSIKMIAGGTGKVKAYVQWTASVVEGSNVEVEATSATEEITLTIAFDKTSADKYENADFRQVCVQFEGVTTSEAVFTEAVLLGATETAISDVKSDVEAVEVARYNLMGQKLSGAERGINIIVYSDGSAKKVLVK